MPLFFYPSLFCVLTAAFIMQAREWMVCTPKGSNASVCLISNRERLKPVLENFAPNYGDAVRSSGVHGFVARFLPHHRCSFDIFRMIVDASHLSSRCLSSRNLHIEPLARELRECV